MADPVTIGIEVALMAAQMALTASQKFEGPRLDSLDVSVADYGTTLPQLWGIRRFDAPIIWAEKLREEKTTSKTKGGKYANYKYYGTFAVLVADQHVDAITRIWLDKHLSYDTTKAGPISLAPLVSELLGADTSDTIKLSQGQNMRVYLGDQTDPDPRIESWCEDRYGANTAPAYKDVTYIVFQDIPLEKFGNRIPQISVECVSSKSVAFPYELLTSGYDLSNASFSADFQRLVLSNGSGFELWDVGSRTKLAQSSAAPGIAHVAVNSDGTFISGSYDFGGSIGPRTTVISEGGFPTAIGGPMGGGVWNAGGGQFGTNGLISNTILMPGDSTSSVTTIPIAFHPTWFFDDEDLAGWAVGGVGDGSGGAYLSGIGFADLNDFNSHIVVTSTSGAAYAIDNGNGQFCTWQGSKLYLINKTTFAIEAGPVSVSGAGSTAFRGARTGAPSIWIGTTQYSTIDLSTLQTITLSDWATGTSGNQNLTYDPINNALWGRNVLDTAITVRYLNRIASSGETLKTVVDAVSDLCGLTGQDTSALTQTVIGYSFTQGSGKDILAPLLDVHDVDPRPHDFQVQFVNRGGSSLGTISTSEMTRDGDESRYVISITQDTDLPRKITFSFADRDHDQQANNVIAQRPLDTLDAQREQTIDISTYVSTPDIAQKFADRYLRRKWMGRQTIKAGVTAQRLGLEPADVYDVETDGISTRARLTKVTLSAGKLNTEWERDGASIAVTGSGTGAAMDGRDPETIYIPGPTKAFVKDIPLLSDADSNANPLLYYGAGPYNTAQNWPGAYFMTGADYDTEWAAVSSSGAAKWGYATSALGNADPWLWDRGNTVNVSGYGVLTSCSEADVDASPSLNLALLGDELINFTTATLEADGSYTLSGFKRGRRGTEWATSTHVAGEEFVLASTLITDEEGLSEVGTTLHFKGQSLARSIDAAPAIDIVYSGASLKPYAPARVKWTTDGTDLFGEIIRRTRVGGAWVGGATIPLSENSEAYEVDVYHGATFKRTIAVSGTNLFTYTAAQMSSDGNAVTSAPPINVYQLSDAVGRGFALAA